MAKIDTKEKIFNSALTLIDQKSFPEVRTREIADNAGISEVTVFRHFKNKGAIFSYLIERFIKFVTPFNFKDIKKEEDFRIELINASKKISEVNIFKIRLLKFILYLGMYKQSKFFNFVKILNAKFFLPIENCIEIGKKKWGYDKNINTKILVRLFVNSIFFFVVQQKVFKVRKIEEYDFDEIVDLAVQNFLKSLK